MLPLMTNLKMAFFSDEERDPADNEDAAGDNDSTDDDASSGDGDREEPLNLEGGCSQDSLTAPTLRLGWDPEVDSPPSVGSDGEPLDSQRPGAWIGKFYQNHRTMGDPEPCVEPFEIHSHDETDKDDDSDDPHPATGHDGDDGEPTDCAGDPKDEPLSDTGKDDAMDDNVSEDGEGNGVTMDDDDALGCPTDSALDYIKRALNLGAQHVMDLTMMF